MSSGWSRYFFIVPSRMLCEIVFDSPGMLENMRLMWTSNR